MLNCLANLLRLLAVRCPIATFWSLLQGWRRENKCGDVPRETGSAQVCPKHCGDSISGVRGVADVIVIRTKTENMVSKKCAPLLEVTRC